MLQTGPTTVLLGGHQPLLLEFDLVTAKETTKVMPQKNVNLLNYY